jgi:hypothetical protein
MSFFAVKKAVPTFMENGSSVFMNLKANKVQNAINYFSKRVVIGRDLLSAPSGIYTWILKPSGFFAIRTLSKQELGTLHANLDVFTDKNPGNPVQAAGEMRITREGNASNIEFNLLSGTYMKRIYGRATPEEARAITESLVGSVKDYLGTFGIPITFLECTDADCKPEERMGGKSILDATLLKTTAENMAVLEDFFEKRGGNRHTKRYTKYNSKRDRKRHTKRARKTRGRRIAIRKETRRL